MKDAKGHGSNARGGASGPTITINKYGQRVLPSASQVPLGKLPGEARVPADNAAASALSQGAPPSKAGPAPVHPGASGRSDTGKPGFYEKRRNLMNANEAFGRGAIGDRTDDAIAAVERLKAAARRK